MTEKPEALRLAEFYEALAEEPPKSPDNSNIRAAAAELRRLHAENFALAAGQCMNVVGDEGGSPICAKAQQLQAARERDNVSFKQLLAQRDALLGLLKEARKIIRATSSRNLVKDWDRRTTATIKAVEEGK